jgi:hypothetical protein
MLMADPETAFVEVRRFAGAAGIELPAVSLVASASWLVARR